LATALEQEASLIIVSTSLLNHIMDKETMWPGYDDLNDQSYLVQDIKVFRPDRWIVKKVNDFLSLLIPVNYLEFLNIDKNKVKEFGNTIHVISDVELQLGLKVNHMETIDYQATGSIYRSLKTQFLSYFYKSSEPEGPEFANYVTNSLEGIFCERSDYQNRKIDIPEWFIYIGGHGGWIHSVAHLSLDDFKTLLHFLDSKINTKLLVVSSCYAEGINAHKIYGEIKLGTQKYYSFPIIIQALNDIAVKADRPEVDMRDMRVLYQDKKIKIKHHIDFVSFFKKAKKLEGNYSEIIKPITMNFVENTPQIKLPGIEWFSVIELDKKIVSMGSTLVKTRDPQKPLDVVSFFKKDPEIILLYTDNILFELVVNSSKMKYIVSMVSPQLTKEVVIPVVTRIKKISSTQSFSDILYWFRLFSHSDASKWFCIDEVDDKKDIIIVRTTDGGMGVFYRDNDGVAFTTLEAKELEMQLKEIKFEKINKDSTYETYYQDMIRRRDEYSKLSEEREKARQEITSEQVEKIENVLVKQLEKQKEIEGNVSEPSVD